MKGPKSSALAAVLMLGVGFGVAVLPASADPRTFEITLAGGRTVKVTIDAPPGTPVDQITIPNISTPIIEVREVEPEPTPQGGPPVDVRIGQREEPEPREPSERPNPVQARDRAEKQPRPARHRRPTAKRAQRPAAARRLLRSRQRRRASSRTAPAHRRAGRPAADIPTFSAATGGWDRFASIGVPNFFIDKFRIPPFLLPIYQAAGTQYGVPWEVLAAINEIETDYGRNLNVSSAGALGWMQFMPATWKAYGVDANDDGVKDPYNPVDAIFAAGLYLRAAGAGTDLARAVFAYNHAGWYVDSVLMRARVIGGLPSNLISSLTGLTQGRFPVPADARYTGGRRASRIFSRAGAAVVAVNDGRIVGIGRTPRLGRFIRLRDAFGNTFTYGHVRADARTRPRPRASDGGPFGSVLRPLPALVEATHRLELARIRPGARVTAGTILGRIGKTSETVAPHLLFEIRPAGTGAPRIDPKPILDGWKLLETTAAYGVVGRNPLTEQPSIGRILLMSKPALIKRVLANPRIDIYGCGRRDVRLRIVDRRVLATLEFLAASGFKPTVTSLRCGHSYYAKGGSVSHHSSGNAVDIAKINGIPVLGHQGPGSIAELAAQRLLTLQGLMKPDQIITLMSFEGADNAFAMADHADHIHVGWRPLDGTDSEAAKQVNASLQPKQWIKLVDRLVALKNPTLADAPNSPRRPR